MQLCITNESLQRVCVGAEVIYNQTPVADNVEVALQALSFQQAARVSMVT